MPSVCTEGVEVITATLKVITHGRGTYEETIELEDSASPADVTAALEARLSELGWTWDDR